MADVLGLFRPATREWFAGTFAMPAAARVTVGIRSGDTPADERRRFQRILPEVLITTPESLFLILRSQAREFLRGNETVIVDEVHAVAGTKRGAHLALFLDRLGALLARPAQRVGLPATFGPIDEVAHFSAASTLSTSAGRYRRRSRALHVHRVGGHPLARTGGV